MAQSRDVMVIDLLGLSAEEARIRFPEVYQWVLERVKPERDHNNRATYRNNWWIFGEPRIDFRPALSGLRRFAATTESARRRFFVFIDGEVLPDNTMVNIATDDAYVLGILSSRIHLVWALATGGRLGVRNDPRYNKTRCFDPFPFPVCEKEQQQAIRGLADSLDAHRKRQQDLHPGLALTKVYKVLDQLRSGEALSATDKVIHEQGLVSVLKKLHDDLDAAVFDAYGWPHDLTNEHILERLVALNAERAAEEKRGIIRWLRPEFQNPTGAKAATQGKLAQVEEAETEEKAENPAAAPSQSAWPKKLPEQIAAVRDLLVKGNAEWTVADVAAAFKGAKKGDIEDVLDSLTALGILAAYEARKARRWKRTRASA
jgi:hypothetical protein